MARTKPRTRYQWGALAVELAGIIEQKAVEPRIRELASAVTTALSAPSDVRAARFSEIDRLMDRVNGIEHETATAKLAREHLETALGPDCCTAHLVKTGHGVMIRGQFATGGHCTNGATETCGSCRRTLVHVCDEADGCSWHVVVPRKTRTGKLGGP